MATREASRPIGRAEALGIARAAYEYSLEYPKERKQFGPAIVAKSEHRVQAGGRQDAYRRLAPVGVAGGVGGPERQGF